ncbi:unnamed protein product [Schistosoma spindalis]|nr:unnamed protein product [Schistosoma spindale]
MNMKFIILTIIVIFTSLLIYGYNAEKAQCGSVSCDVGETFLHERYCCKDLLNRDDCCKKIRSNNENGFLNTYIYAVHTLV